MAFDYVPGKYSHWPITRAPALSPGKTTPGIEREHRPHCRGSSGSSSCRRDPRRYSGAENILVVGATGSGKTTLVNAILNELSRIAPEDRVVSIEDTTELQCSVPNHVDLRAVGGVSMLDCLRACMRLKPTRIVVGEVRGPEAHALLKAWNTGHPGGAATVHANDALSGLIRMESLVAEATSAPQQMLRSDRSGRLR